MWVRERERACMRVPIVSVRTVFSRGKGGFEPLQLGDLRDAALLEVLDDGLRRVLLGDRVPIKKGRPRVRE